MLLYLSKYYFIITDLIKISLMWTFSWLYTFVLSFISYNTNMNVHDFLNSTKTIVNIIATILIVLLSYLKFFKNKQDEK